MFDTLAILDVETTGMSPVRDRIIEIGVIRVEKGKIVEAFESLVNPQCYLPPEITMLTGIHAGELENAPSFDSLREKIRELLDGAMFVAHNARFDYSFIRSEFARCEHSFSSKLLCTARLSRVLYPRYRHHNLDSIIERLGVSCDARHRAMGDARVLWEFLRHVERTVNPEKLGKAVNIVTKAASLPPGISKDTIAKLPESPGVYIFFNREGVPIYIGKSINLKDRVLSHFADAMRNTKEGKVFQSIASIEIRQTDGELGALLTESKLIKQYKPLYNRLLREVEYFTVLLKRQNTQGYLTVEMKEVITIHPDEIDAIVAVFRSRGQAKKYLTQLTDEHMLCKKLLSAETAKGACFGFQLETCHGACVGKEPPAKYNLRFLEAFRKTKLKQWPFAGPIAIREGNTAHVVSHWCYMGQMNESNPDTTVPSGDSLSFDYDTYKILSRHLLKRSVLEHVKVLTGPTGETVRFPGPRNS